MKRQHTTDSKQRRGSMAPRAGLGLVVGLLCGPTASHADRSAQVDLPEAGGMAPGGSGRALSPPLLGSCMPSVVLEGDAALTPGIAQALQARGLRTVATDGCPATRVSVQRRDPYVLVQLRDETRPTQRQVADRETAAALIESWVRSDLSAPLLLGSVAPTSMLPPMADPQVAAGPVARALPRGSLSLHAQLAGDVTGNAWMGASLRGCLFIHRVCVGSAWQTLAQLEPTSRDGRRVVTELFATAALPARVGPLWLWPSIGLGVSWLHIGARLPRLDSGMGSSGGSDNDTPSSPSLGETTVAASADQGRMQGELRLDLAVPLRHAFSLCLGVALDATLTSRSPPLLMGPPARDGEPSTDVAQLSLPPWGLFIGQLGLLWSPK